MEETLRRSVQDYPAQPRFACALAHVHTALGRIDEVRAGLDQLIERASARDDPEWLFSLALLAEPCAAAKDAGVVEKLWTLLRPYEDLYAQAPVEAAFGSVARTLGVLATAAGDFNAAEGHFSAALEVEHRMRALPWIAHAQRDLASMLIARGIPRNSATPATSSRKRSAPTEGLGWRIGKCIVRDCLVASTRHGPLTTRPARREP